MTDHTTYLGIPIPSDAEAATVPAFMMSAFLAAEGHMNATVTSKGDRDANLNGFPAGGLAICPSLKTIWMSLGKNPGDANTAWITAYANTGWITSGFVLANSDWQFSGSTRLRRVGSVIDFVWQVTYNGSAAITAGSDGNIAGDPFVMTIPLDYQPSYNVVDTFRSGFSGGEVELNNSGELRLISANSNSTIAPGGYVRGRIVWSADD